MSKRVLLVAATTGYQTQRFEETARRLGFDVTLGIDRCVHLEGSWGKEAVPLRFEKPEAAASTLAKVSPKPDGIVAVGDKPAEIASLAAASLKLPFHPRDAVLASRNKWLARKRFEAAGLPVPEYFFMPGHMEPEEGARRVLFPCVVKPLGLSGSRGVIRANVQQEFCAAVKRIRALLQAPDIRRAREEDLGYILVESYIPGREFAVEGILTGGRLKALAIFDKPDPLEGPFFEETIYTTPSRESESVQASLIEATQAGVRALGLKDGPIHAEMRHNEHGVWLLEIAARPIGGLCAGALRFNDAVSLEELIIRHAVGEDVTHLRREEIASGVMMIPIPASGIYNGVSGVSPDVIITAVPGQRLLQLPEGSSYLGFIFKRAETPALVEQALRDAHSALHFDIAAELPVV
jgi:biotin carboxylase